MSESNEHTPGAWRYSEYANPPADGRFAGFVISDPATTDAFVIAEVVQHDTLGAVFENGPLLAAAPELLAAGQAILNADERGQGLPFAEACRMMSAAIAKAKGES